MTIQRSINSSRAILLITIPLFVLMTSCGKKTDQDKIAEAQECIDRATASTVSACRSLVEGMETKTAYLIRCVSVFVEEGYSNPQKIVSAIQARDAGGQSGGASSLSMMSALAFTTSSNATLVSNYCAASSSKGLMMLASLSVMATAAKNLGGCGSNVTAACLSAATSDPATAALIGSAVASAYSSNCTTGTSNALCSQFSSAIGSGATNEQIGQCVAYCMTTPNGTCSATGKACTGYQ